MTRMLSGYRVLELTPEYGHLCGQVLADLHADVVVVEPPGGAPARTRNPFYQNVRDPEGSLFWWAYNRGKRSITLNTEVEAGRELLRGLVRNARFVVESYPPRHLAARGIGYNELSALNGELVMVSITPFGQNGPKASYQATDLVVGAACGQLGITGDSDRAPIRVGAPQAFEFAGAEAAVAALIAHYDCVRSGRGQHVDVSAQETNTIGTGSSILSPLVGDVGYQRMAGGQKFGRLVLRNVFPARDGYVCISLFFGPAIGPFTCRLMEWICEEGFCDETTRDKDWIAYGQLLRDGSEPVEEFERVKRVIESFTRTKTKAELLAAALQRSLAMIPISTMKEVLDNEQLRARNFWRPVEHSDLRQTFVYPGPFAAFSRTPIELRLRPPHIGEHNREIYGELGVDEAELASLRSRGVV